MIKRLTKLQLLLALIVGSGIIFFGMNANAQQPSKKKLAYANAAYSALKKKDKTTLFKMFCNITEIKDMLIKEMTKEMDDDSFTNRIRNWSNEITEIKKIVSGKYIQTESAIDSHLYLTPFTKDGQRFVGFILLDINADVTAAVNDKTGGGFKDKNICIYSIDDIWPQDLK